jgi:hypothetical protein
LKKIPKQVLISIGTLAQLNRAERMSWQLSNTVTYSSGADIHTAMVYLFDTALSGLTNWTVSAHPDASAFKRSVKRTTANLYGGANVDNYFYVSWGSTTSPGSLTFYEDATYTTTPGDLGTDITNAFASALTNGMTSESIKFWTSTVNSNALLVTRGKSVLFWEPGFSAATYRVDTAWDGSTDSGTSHYFPFLRTAMVTTNGEVGALLSSAELNVIPGLPKDDTNQTFSGLKASMTTNFPWIHTMSSNTETAAGAGIAFYGLGEDVAAYRSVTTTNEVWSLGDNIGQGALWLADGTYWLNPQGANETQNQIMFNMGATEPDLT